MQRKFSDINECPKIYKQFLKILLNRFIYLSGEHEKDDNTYNFVDCERIKSCMPILHSSFAHMQDEIFAALQS